MMGKTLVWAGALIALGVMAGTVQDRLAAAVVEVRALRLDLQRERATVRLLTRMVGDMANARPCLFWDAKCPVLDPVVERDL